MDKMYANSIGRSGPDYATAALEPRQPPISNLYSALDKLRKAASFTGEIANRLCGPVPEGKVDGQSIDTDGIFDQIDNVSREISSLVEGIASDMNRISNRL